VTRYSRRLPWDQPENEFSRLLQAKRATNAVLLDLTESNPTSAGLHAWSGDMLAALADPRALRYEPSPAGLEEARSAVAQVQNVDARRVLLTASTSEAYSYLLKLWCDPGDEILVPRPSYPLFEFLAALENVSVKQYSLHYSEGWWIDMESVRGAVTDRTRAIVIVNPNNPTGSYCKRGEMDALVSLGLPIISDEVFADYCLNPASGQLRSVGRETRVPVFCLGGLSKSLGLPQMKLGWIIHDGSEAVRHRLELIADTYLSVSAPVQHAAAQWLAGRDSFQQALLSRLKTNLGHVPEALHVEGGWYAILRLPSTRTEEDWTLHLLRDHNVVVQPGYFFDFETEPYAVISLLTLPETFREGINRIRAAQLDG
jgi:alanine-synthesizing transaminase